MRKIGLALALSLSLLVGVDAASAQSGKSYSSGRSSSGSSSSGKSYSSGGSKSSSSGKSYSSGGSKPSSGGTGTSSSGKSYSSGGGKSSTPGPASPGKSTSPGASKPPAGTPSGPTTPPKGKSYGSGASDTKSTPSGKSYTTGSDPVSRKPGPGASYDPQAGRAQAKEESRARFTKGQEPRSTYTTPQGERRTIDPKDTRIEDLRRQLDHERWVNREQRRRDSYGPYHSRPPVVYNDPYSSIFWWWLLDQSLERRALWAYHHRGSMDEARYRDLLARDARLEGRVRDLEREMHAKGVEPDPSFSFDENSPDLMYTDEYVEAAYNPQPRTTGTSWGRLLGACLVIGLMAAVVVGLIWLVFFKRWGSTE